MSGVKEIVAYRISRAGEAMEMAALASGSGYWNHVSNRLYYALFYMVSAYLASIQDDAKTHNGVRVKFHQLLIKSDILEPGYGRFYDLMFNNRQDADYSDFLIFTKEDVYPLIEQTEELLKLIQSLIKI